ncbi:transglycosylase SLT domain-containing protein [Streptomyces sp. SBT349]|uniref:transglycosylase SLT domain-containing protein n=1 Tax=Streptomyces sp. SBT349 TaxID=1580539 RepID=UPI0007C8167B|nr:transglycosylase SLT domain-containing protein [Streptomyces sp. SBT349]
MTASTNGTRRTLTHTVALAGIVTAGTAALTLPFAPGASADEAGAHGATQAAEGTAAPMAYAPQAPDGLMGQAPGADDDRHDDGGPDRDDRDDRDDAQRDRGAERDDDADRGTAIEKADKGRGADYTDDGRLVVIPKHEQPDARSASDEDIDRWIDEALEIMDEKDIPGSYDAIHSNLMRESSGDPHTINMWDTNAEKNIPSKGLLQVIDPTFEQYHVEGTSDDIYDPVANITAACNYAADRYGSMDNVDSAY